MILKLDSFCDTTQMTISSVSAICCDKNDSAPACQIKRTWMPNWLVPFSEMANSR